MLKLINRALIVLSIVSVTSVFSDSKPIGKGKGFFQFTTKYIRAKEYYTPAGDVINIPTIKDYTTSLYGEWGINDQVSLILNLGLYRHWVINEQITANKQNNTFNRLSGKVIRSFGDSELGVKIGLGKAKKWDLATSLSVGLPLSEWKTERKEHLYILPDGAIVNDDEGSFAIPIGNDDYPITIAISGDFSPIKAPIELSASLGWQNRRYGLGSKNYSDQVVYTAKIGYPHNRAYYILSLQGQEPIRNGNIFKDTRFLGFGPQVYVRVTKNVGVLGGIETAVRSQQTLRALAFKCGFYYKL